MLRELRLGVINLPRIERGEGLIPEFPPEEELPPITFRVDRDWVERFAAKNRWSRPRFWFGDGPAGRPAGRPQLAGWEQIQGEMERRIREGEAEESWRAESNYLAEWIANQMPRLKTPSAKRIAGLAEPIERIWAECRRKVAAICSAT